MFWAAGIRAFTEGLQGACMVVMARECFYVLDATVLKHFCEEMGIDIPPGADLFTICWAMVKWFLGLSDEETLKIVLLRCARLGDKDCIDDMFLEVDEFTEVVEHADLKTMKGAQDDIKKKRTAANMFRESYRVKARSIYTKAHGPPVAPKHRRLIPGEMDQTTAKKYIPEGSHIWQGVKRPEWCGHVRPFVRITAPYARYGGQHEALLFVLRTMWKQDLFKSGLSYKLCPFEGVFQDEE